MQTLAALLTRTDLTVTRVVTAPACTNDRYVYAAAVYGRSGSCYYVVRVADDALVGRVLWDPREMAGPVAQLPDGSVAARGSVGECLLALWQLDSGSLSPVARKAIAAA